MAVTRSKLPVAQPSCFASDFDFESAWPAAASCRLILINFESGPNALRVADDNGIVGVAAFGGDECGFGRFEKRLALSADSSAQI